MAWSRSRAFDFGRMMASLATPPLPPRTRRGWLLFALGGAAAIAAAHGADSWAWAHLHQPSLYDRDAWRLARLMGYLPTYAIVALALVLHDRDTAWSVQRARLVFLVPVAGGAIAELGKLLVRRARPDLETFGYAWRAYTDHPFSTGGLGMPSSHTMVAMAGAVALTAVFPRAWWLWYLLAVACGLSRVIAVGHFLSDVVAATFLGIAVGALTVRLLDPRGAASSQVSPVAVRL
jgi:membrane-associated phospholipid phosphatase